MRGILSLYDLFLSAKHMPSQVEGLFCQYEMSFLSDVIGLFCLYDRPLLSAFFISVCMTHTESSGRSLLSGFYISFDGMTKK